MVSFNVYLETRNELQAYLARLQNVAGDTTEYTIVVPVMKFGDLDGPLMRVTALDTPVPYAPSLEEYFLPNKEKVLHAARTLAKY